MGISFLKKFKIKKKFFKKNTFLLKNVKIKKNNFTILNFFLTLKKIDNKLLLNNNSKDNIILCLSQK